MLKAHKEKLAIFLSTLFLFFLQRGFKPLASAYIELIRGLKINLGGDMFDGRLIKDMCSRCALLFAVLLLSAGTLHAVLVVQSVTYEPVGSVEPIKMSTFTLSGDGSSLLTQAPVFLEPWSNFIVNQISGEEITEDFTVYVLCSDWGPNGRTGGRRYSVLTDASGNVIDDPGTFSTVRNPGGPDSIVFNGELGDEGQLYKVKAEFDNKKYSSGPLQTQVDVGDYTGALVSVDVTGYNYVSPSLYYGCVIQQGLIRAGQFQITWVSDGDDLTVEVTDVVRGVTIPFSEYIDDANWGFAPPGTSPRNDYWKEFGMGSGGGGACIFDTKTPQSERSTLLVETIPADNLEDFHLYIDGQFWRLSEITSMPEPGTEMTITTAFGKWNEDYTEFNQYPDPIYPGDKWKIDITTAFYLTGGALKGSSPAIDSDGTVYVGSNDSCLYAIHPDGTLKWKSYLDRIHYSSPVIGDDGVIYIGSFVKGLFAVNPDGTVNFNFRYPYPLSTLMVLATPAVDCNNGKIYFGALDNYVYSINTDGTFNWRYETGQYIHSAPAIGTDGTVYIGSTDGFFYALNPDGSLKWQYETGDQIEHSSPAIDLDGTIYIGSKDGYLYAFNPDGTVKWSYQASSITSSPTIAVDGTIYFGAGAYLYALNSDGSLKWKLYGIFLGETGSPTISSDGTIYAGSYSSMAPINLSAVSPYGSILWEQEVSDRIFCAPAISEDGIVYVASINGALHAFDSGTNAGLANSPWPKFAHDARNTGCAHGIGNLGEIVEGIREYIEEMEAAAFDNPAHQNALINQLEALAAEIEDLNPTAALARLDNIRKRVEKWVEDEEDKAAILAMIDRLIAYLETQETPGQGKGKAQKGAALAAVSLPEKFQLLQNSPNPFNPSTTISYSVPEGNQEYVTLNVYDLRGRLVRTLVKRMIGPGTYSVYWDGTDESGRQVSSGVYLYRLQAGKFMQTRKMVILK